MVGGGGSVAGGSEIGGYVEADVGGCSVGTEFGKQVNIDCGKADGGVGLGALSHTICRIHTTPNLS